MEFSREKMRQIRRLMVLAAVLVLAVIYSSQVFQGARFLLGIFTPFLMGGVIAFVLNIPMRAFEEKLFGQGKGKEAGKARRPLCLVLAIVSVLFVISIVVGTVVPQVASTAAEIGKKIPAFMDNVIEEVDRLAKNYPEFTEQIDRLGLEEINWDSMLNSILDFMKNGAGDMLNSTVSVASGIISGIVNAVISFIFALYILVQKERLGDQGRRLLTAYLPEPVGRKILEICSLLYRNFSSFITGQCLEAVILGIMFAVAMSVCGMPYALMVGVLIAFTALIPIVGAFIGCGVGAFVILIDDPLLALWFVILFLVLQQLEGNLIYPKVVGNSVGLPAIWVLMAVSVGGSLFGIAGMLFFIPLMSSGYALLRESVNERNAGKQILTPPRGEDPEENNTHSDQDIPQNPSPGKSQNPSPGKSRNPSPDRSRTRKFSPEKNGGRKAGKRP